MKFVVYNWRVYYENSKSLLVSSQLSLEKQLIRSSRQITNILSEIMSNCSQWNFIIESNLIKIYLIP